MKRYTVTIHPSATAIQHGQIKNTENPRLPHIRTHSLPAPVQGSLISTKHWAANFSFVFFSRYPLPPLPKNNCIIHARIRTNQNYWIFMRLSTFKRVWILRAQYTDAMCACVFSSNAYLWESNSRRPIRGQFVADSVLSQLRWDYNAGRGSNHRCWIKIIKFNNNKKRESNNV